MPTYQNWLLALEPPLATLTLNRPERHNSLNSEVLTELRDICSVLRPRRDIWVVILRGRGAHFSTGFDPDLIRQHMAMPAPAVRELLAGHQACLAEFESLEKLTIAQIHGFCIGGGFLLALCCDFRIASRRTIFSLPEVRLGIPIAWGTQRITRVAGVGLAKRLILLGERFKAADALAWGLIHEVVEEEALEASVAALAGKLLKLPPPTLAVAKRIINESAGRYLAGTEALELAAITELLDSPDVQEAMTSYFEHRNPRYSGE